MAEVIINNFSTTLASGYTSGSGTASLTSASGLPSASSTYTLGVFPAADATAPPIVLLRVSNRSGTTVTVAAEGTDTSAPSGSVVVAVESALAIATYVSEHAGSTSPGGSSGQIQYNNSNAFGGFTASGDATINTGTGAVTLAASGVSAATYGDSTHVAQIAVDAKGRVTSASSVAISGGSGGGALVLLEQHTASSSASLNFTACISSTYDAYQIELVEIVPATDAQTLRMRMSTNGGSSYDSTSNYAWSELGWSSSGSAAGGSQSDTSLGFGDSQNNAAPGLCGTIKLYNPANSSSAKALTANLVGIKSSDLPGTVVEGWTIGGKYLNTSAYNAFQFFFPSGSISTGTIRVYGIAKT